MEQTNQARQTNKLFQEIDLLKGKQQELQNQLAKAQAHITSLTAQLKHEQLRAQQAEEEASHWNELLDSLPQITWLALPDGHITYFNQRWHEHTGQRMEESQGDGWQRVIYPDDHQYVEHLLEKIRAGQEWAEAYRIYRASDNTWRWHLSRTKPMIDQNGAIRHWVGTSTDVHDQKEEELKNIDQAKRRSEEMSQAAEALYKSREQFRFMAEMIPQIVWTARPDGYEDYHNKRFFEYSGISVQEAEGDGWQQIVHPDDLEPMREALKKSYSTGDPYQIEYRFRRYDGEFRWFLGRALALKNNKGKVLKWFGTSTDIHDKKETSLQLGATNQELTRVNEQLDNFVYMAAHDLKSPVNNLRMIFEIASKEPDITKKNELLELVISLVNRLDSTINGLVEVIEVENNSNSVTKVYFQDVLTNITTDQAALSDLYKNHIRVDFSTRDSITYLESYLHSIMTNLLTNAIKYHSPSRPLRVDITTTLEEDFTVLTIQDNGIGIDLDHNKDKLFQPFKRFTQQAQGTGVGLYIIKSIVERNGGRIEVESKINVGTTFRCYLKEFSKES